MTSIQGILYIATLYNLVLAVIILWNTRTRRAGGSFAWYILSTAAWTACVATIQFNSLQDITIWLIRGSFVIGVCTAVTGMWFCAEFPLPSPKFRRLAHYLAWLGLPWLLLSWHPLMIPTAHFRDWGVEAEVGPLVLPYTVWIGCCILASIAQLIRQAQRLRGLERLQVRYVLLGIIGLAITALIPNLILPALTGSTRYAPLGPLASLFVTTTTTYAIMRYRLLDIRVVLRAGLVYSLTIGLLSLLFALLVPLLEHLLSTVLPLPSGTSSFLMAFLIVLAFTPLRNQVQRWVDLRFFKNVYDFHNILRTAGNALAAVNDRDALVTIVRDALTQALLPRGVAVYLPGPDGAMTAHALSGAWEHLPEIIPPTDPVLGLKNADRDQTVSAREERSGDTASTINDEVLVAGELLRQPRPLADIGQRLLAWDAAVAIPLIAGNRLRGMVLLGEKLSGDLYTGNDVGLLRILGKQAAIALDDARHFDEVVSMNAYHTRLLNTMQDGAVALDPRGQIITFNHAAERITGVPAAEAMGHTLGELGLAGLSVEAEDGQAHEITLVTRTRQQIPVLLTVTPFSRRWEIDQSHLIVIRDLSALRALEYEKLQAERFSSMGAMAASLAHEIITPLTPIRAFAHLLPSRYDDAGFRREFSQTVTNEVEKINRLVSQMLDLVRQPAAERGMVDMREVIEHLLVLIQPDCEAQHIHIAMLCFPNLPLVAGMTGQLYQAVLNVLLHAIHAMPEGGELTIALQEEPDTLVCRITDTGQGVAPQALATLFDPPATPEETSGLGLALTHHFIQAHGGKIRAESPPGAGLSITIALPVWRRKGAEVLCS